MLILPEVDDLIFQQLSRHDLTQCARVSWTWHKIAISHLWNDLTCLEKSLSIMAKYGPWIRTLRNPRKLRRLLINSLQRFSIGQGKKPTADELLLHVFQHCPNIRIQELELHCVDMEWSAPWLRTVEAILPHVLHLSVEANAYLRPLQDLSKLQEALGRCSDTLDALDLTADISGRGLWAFEGDDEDMDEAKVWTSLKCLTLRQCSDTSIFKTFWPWLWKQCSHAEKLVVLSTDKSVVKSLVQGILTKMHRLDEIRLAPEGAPTHRLTDNDITALLSSSCKGWKVVSSRLPARFGNSSMSALAKHASTLEALFVEQDPESEHAGLVRILATCPKLHTLVAIGESLFDDTCPQMDVNVFIDRDGLTGSLRPWACETTLRVLKIGITGIPRPDLYMLDNDLNKELYHGQGRDLQSQVYDRLARLINLETLWLAPKELETSLVYDDNDNYSSLEMSLESGLWKLVSLKSLKELGLPRQARIGEKELNWMRVNWPNLNIIYGLREDDIDEDMT
ncbi:hypothetical protein BGX31_001750 [Mortierella sp. GBA43]|nr:hypothetical protein BGX31_001750 [Mortierella sp. GBA43]